MILINENIGVMPFSSRITPIIFLLCPLDFYEINSGYWGKGAFEPLSPCPTGSLFLFVYWMENKFTNWIAFGYEFFFVLCHYVAFYVLAIVKVVSA